MKGCFRIAVLLALFEVGNTIMSTTMRKSKTSEESTAYEQSTTVVIGEIEYYLDQAPAHVITFQPSRPLDGLSSRLKGDLRPCTVINWSKDQLNKEDLDSISAGFALHDDVWTPAFLEVVVLKTPHTSKICVVRDGALVVSESESTHLTTGPYAIRPSTGEILRVSRLYDDDCCAFIGASLAFSAQLHSFQWLMTGNRIAVPSRLGSERTSTRPLARLRFAVKDTIDVVGLETGLGNRSYRRLYPGRASSAQCIDRLVDAGAILVGKTKTTQFAEGEVPTQWTDYLAPFNPRGDSYQSPSSSSSGSAVASAAYPWLDFTIGTDTGGSTRHPAGVCGTYGMRASTNIISTAGIYSVSPLLDSLGVFTRSAPVVEAVMKSLMESSRSSSVPSKLPVKYKLLYPIRAPKTKPQNSRRWFPYPGEPGNAADVEDLFEETVQKLESHLQCTRSPFNLDDLWRQTRPTGQDESLDKATGGIYTVLTTHSCVRETVDPFIADFKAANNGRSPFIDSVVKARQDHGRSLTTLQYETAVKSAKVFSQWFNEIVLAKSAEDEFPLLIFPQSWGSPDYRDEPENGPLFFSSFSIYSLSYLSGCPDCTVPVGEMPCQSRVTEAEMFLPVSLSVLSPRGTDLQLLALLSELEKVGVLRPVKAGMRMYAEA